MNSTGGVAVATISTANYWPYTAVLIESLTRTCPEWEIYVLALTELPETAIPEHVHLLRAQDLWGSEVQLCQSRFNLFEWACASKPRLLRFLLDKTGASLAVYADSDMEFFAPPQVVLHNANSIILQPNVAALEECKSAAWERLHLQYGVYNGGFLAVPDTSAARAFIDWWDERVTRYCCTDPVLDAFSDQRWLDMAPGLFPDVFIDRDLASNVAVWNVAGRNLREINGTYVVNDKPLSFFHYHRVRLGMDVEDYLKQVDHHPVVSDLVRSYLSRASRHASAHQGPAQRHDVQGDGTAVSPIVYRAVRDTLAEGAFTLDPQQPGADVAEHLRASTFECPRLRARMRVLSYHWAHARHMASPEERIDRYERSFLYRGWIDLWFVVNGPRHAQLPENWTLRAPWKRTIRKMIVRVLRVVAGR